MLSVTNRHEQVFAATVPQIAALTASLSSPEDRLWPRQWWPPMQFDRPLAVGAVGGHGPIRYTVARCDPAEAVVFQFSAPRGFNGTHAYYVEAVDEAHTRLVHVLSMRTTGAAVLSWLLVYRPLHDALIEDSLKVAEASLAGTFSQHADWSWYVRWLRARLARPKRENIRSSICANLHSDDKM